MFPRTTTPTPRTLSCERPCERVPPLLRRKTTGNNIPADPNSNSHPSPRRSMTTKRRCCAGMHLAAVGRG
jgi:hypothetical protein